jgi:asparagine N-glycosylation enzyme membrane subunit Stt3
MSRWLAPLALLLALAVAGVAREAQAPAHRVPDGGRLPSGSSWLVDDPDACYHLRRVQIGIATGEVPDSDRFLNHPEGSPIPWPTFFDAFLAAVAERLAPGLWNRETGRLDEARLEALLVHAPPVLGVLAVLLTSLAALSARRRDQSSPWPAVLAAWVLAGFPLAVWYSGVARVDHHVMTGLLLAGLLWSSTWGLDADDEVDGLTGAMLAGLFGGLSLLTWLASAIFLGLVGAVVLLAACFAGRERSVRLARFGVLFFATAAVVVGVPAASSAWNTVQPGSLINLSSGVPRALLAAAAPFLLLAFAPRWRQGSWRPLARLAAASLCIGFAALALPGFLSGALEGFTWASRQNSFMAVVAESEPLFAEGWAGAVRDLGWVLVLLPVALACPLGDPRRASRWLLFALLVVLLVLTLGQRRFANSLAVPLAVALATSLGDLARWGRERPGGAGRAALGGALALGALAMLDSLGTCLWRQHHSPEELRDLAEFRYERLRGLQTLRELSPSPGPWNSPGSRQDYGVLAVWGLGHPIEYHARRPTIATNFGSFVGADNYRDHARALLQDDPQAFLEACRLLGADYVVVGARQVSELVVQARIAQWDDDERRGLFEGSGRGKRYSARASSSALMRLALHDRPVGSRAFAGAELIWRSERCEDLGGRTSVPGAPGAGPVLSIYRLPARELEADVQLAPR